VCHRGECFAIILLLASEGVEELFGEGVYKYDKEGKKKQRRKVGLIDQGYCFDHFIRVSQFINNS